ncbi:hypothetical protein AYJ54_37680 [Bradyrhizobium centrolobii]|uniref:Uncharacterized protein n=1 Tax=Bradyrhizobium centrolobii TaxID=1505087 RepID=A0A176Z7C0_9BRAD|nr:hypothetical protein [Bradyrhizobium centrolobii]OAF16621.1 hypothetical protein AYJ54_37680 [Bradyrhizobium centrolobii]
MTAAVVVAIFVRGQTQVARDGRTAVLLVPDERDLVLSEMRGVLASVHGIVEAVSAGDMKAVAADRGVDAGTRGGVMQRGDRNRLGTFGASVA